jgi:hypothetical protein
MDDYGKKYFDQGIDSPEKKEWRETGMINGQRIMVRVGEEPDRRRHRKLIAALRRSQSAGGKDTPANPA